MTAASTARAAAFRARYGPWALVCGASEGLGAEFAEQLAARGLDLALVARRRERLEAFARALAARHGVQVRPLALDLGSREDLAALCGEALASLEVGLLVCNAASGPVAPFLDQTAAQHETLLAVNCRAPALLAHHFAGPMAARGRGGVVLLSSIAGLQGTALVAHYAASKAYLRVLAEGLWAELAPRGVRVLACAAGPTDTPTYRATRPAREGAGVELPPVQSAAAVVRETLAALEREEGGPVCVPGAANRVFGFMLRRLLPTATAVRLVSASTRKMYRGT